MGRRSKREAANRGIESKAIGGDSFILQSYEQLSQYYLTVSGIVSLETKDNFNISGDNSIILCNGANDLVYVLNIRGSIKFEKLSQINDSTVESDNKPKYFNTTNSDCLWESSCYQSKKQKVKANNGGLISQNNRTQNRFCFSPVSNDCASEMSNSSLGLSREKLSEKSIEESNYMYDNARFTNIRNQPPVTEVDSKNTNKSAARKDQSNTYFKSSFLKKTKYTERISNKMNMKPNNESIARSCTTCGFTCKGIASLKKHISYHVTGMKCYRNRLYKRGVKKKQLQISSYSCCLCGLIFRSVHALKHHLQSNHVPDSKPVNTEIENRQNQSTLQTSSSCLRLSNCLCPICGIKFESEKRLTEHFELEHFSKEDLGIRSCHLCFLKFNTLTELKDHTVSKHLSPTTEDKFSCGVCGYKTNKYFELKKHYTSHSTDKRFLCNVCGENLKTELAFRKHMTKHSDICIKCSKCAFTCYSQEVLETHELKKHENESKIPYRLPKKMLSCEICGYESPNKSRLQEHMLRHSDETPFTCNICNYSGKTKARLKIHMVMHSNERNWRCHICLAEFKRKGALESHKVFKHSSFKPFACDLCSLRCKRHSDLLGHIRKVHTLQKKRTLVCASEKTLSCPHCDYKSEKKRNLRVHINRNHTGEKLFRYKCPACSFVAPTRAILEAHRHDEEESKHPMWL